MKKRIVVVSQNTVMTETVGKLLPCLYEIFTFNTIQSALAHIYDTTPNLVIIDMNDDAFTIGLLGSIKEDPLFHQLPVLGILPDDFAFELSDTLPVEDYLWKADLERDMVARATLSIQRSERIVEINPLTRLPGNISINRQIQDRLDRGIVFAFAYADLDHFKPFNDTYGFSRGDEVIKIAGRLILNIVKNSQPENSFVGHIGGDDFVFLMDEDLIEETSREIIGAFDDIIPTFYDPEDRYRGSIEARDRQGNKTKFDIMSISLGITDTGSRTFSHYGEMTERASEMKKYAKEFKGSCYRLDRRRVAAGE